MTSRDPPEIRRPDLGDRFQRDLKRFREREPGHRSFWQSMSVLGAVGWPIVLLTAGGALLGHWLDIRWDTGVRLTLILVTLGAALGSTAAWQMIRGTRT
ncbi:ATPase F0F1 [bacterium]|nr:ATPase F0F1 [bacterium]